MPMLLALLVLCLGGALHAQEDDSPAGEEEAKKPTKGIEEIVITSQGIETPLQEASISVAAFDEQYLQALGAQNIQDISQFTPNLEIRSPYAATNPTLFIRGVGLRDFNANSASAVAVYNDGVYMNSPVGQLAQLFDIQQVEILRGPQGALYGRNASAGAILVHSRKPVGDSSGYTRFTYGRFNQREVEGAFELPLVPDMLSMRIAGRMNLRDGYTKNRCGEAIYSTPQEDPSATPTFRDKVHGMCFNGRVDPVFDTHPPTFEPTGPPLWSPVGTITPIEGGGWGWEVGKTGLTPKWVNDTDNWSGRALFRFQPNEENDWLLNVHGGNNDGDARQFQQFSAFRQPDGDLVPSGSAIGYRDYDSCALNDRGECPSRGDDPQPNVSPEDGDPYAGDYDFVRPDDVDLLGVNLTGDVYLGDFRFRSVTGFESNRRNSGLDLDGSSFITVRVFAFNEAKQASQDLRVYWDNGGSFTWQAGGNFLYEKLKVHNKFSLLRSALFSDQFYEQETFYGSAYTYLTWAISEVFSLEGGLRWNVDHRDFEISSKLSSLQSGRSGSGPVQTTQFTEDAPTGDISINYKPYEGVNFYAKFSRGWKGPHINGLILNNFDEAATLLAGGGSLLDPVKPETVTAGEIGLKSMWWDQRLRINGAAFYYDYDHIQVFQVRNSTSGFPLFTLLSANDAELFGVELEVEMRPLEGWAPPAVEGLQIFLSGSWLEGQYNDFEDVRSDPGQAGNIILDEFSGNQLINAPKYSFIGYVQWPLEVATAGTITPRFDWSYKSRIFFGPENLDLVSQGSLWLMNLRVGYRTPGGSVEVAGWVRNLTDEIYRGDAIDLSRLSNSIVYAMGEPRTYGVTLELRF